MSDFKAGEPLILFEIGKALAEGRDFKDAVERWWNVDPERAVNYGLVLGKQSGKVKCAFRPVPGSWTTRDDGRWGFNSNYATDVWTDYVGKEVPTEYRTRSPFQYIDP